jgi:ribA/ribD-fused uncharacterized protein
MKIHGLITLFLTLASIAPYNIHAFNTGRGRGNCTGQAIRAIEKGDLAEFQRLVPTDVSVDATSSQGHSLLSIAKFRKQQPIVTYIQQQLTGRAIHAIEQGNLAEFKRFVPSQVPPTAQSGNGRTLSAIAKFHHQQEIFDYLESQLKTTASTSATARPSSRKVIEFYEKGKPYYEFTNFYEGSPITINGQKWKTSEHYFQAQKFVGPSFKLQQQVRDQATPRAAFEFARNNDAQKRADWETVKDDIMGIALLEKFTQNAKLKQLLIDTGDAQLVEASPVDSYWGYAKDKKGNPGKNMLGQLLMQLRAELKKK